MASRKRVTSTHARNTLQSLGNIYCVADDLVVRTTNESIIVVGAYRLLSDRYGLYSLVFK